MAPVARVTGFGRSSFPVGNVRSLPHSGVGTSTGISVSLVGLAQAMAVLGGLSEENLLRSLERRWYDVGVASQTAVRARASGRPGPRVITGDLRRSVTVSKVVRSGSRVGVSVGTNIVYARRIEHGFLGPDSIGRTYATPGRYPYMRPAVDDEIPKIAVKAVGVAIEETL